MEKLLNYLLTSDFNDMDDASPQKFKELLSGFRYEYRMLVSKNNALTHEIDRLKGELENISGILNEKNIKYNNEVAALEDKLHFTEAKLNKKLTFKERLNGKINRS